MKNYDIEKAFEQFKKHFPDNNDMTLIILKGHLLIEEQIWYLIKNRVENETALTEASLTSHQKICLAEALTDEFSEDVNKGKWVWNAIKKLNKLRNDIAHNLSASGIEDRVKDYVNRVPDFKESIPSNLILDFEWAILNTVFCINSLIEKTNPEDFENLDFI